MNIAAPVSSEIDTVEFTFLSPKEITAISVKRIENDSTFDTLLNPVPGGLYDPALGSWGDSPCSTCNLNSAACPGHPGHIVLPAPVYHPVFLDQMYHLLRSTCVYCKGFRLSLKEKHKYICQLRLLQYGLSNEAHMVGSIGENELALDIGNSIGLGGSEAEDEDSPGDNVVRARERYVRRCLKGKKLKRSDTLKDKHEGASEMRRHVIKEFLSQTTKKTCLNCKGISPTYRRDRYVKIFEKPLTDKERATMAQRGSMYSDALQRVYDRESKLKQHPEQDPASDSDEGVADVGSPRDPEPRDSLEEEDDDDDKRPSAQQARAPLAKQRYLSPMEVRARLTELFETEQVLLSLVYNAKPQTKSSPRVTCDMFFLSVLMVPPNRYRPEARTGDSEVAEAQQNSLYKNILRCSSRMALTHHNLKDGRGDIADLHNVGVELQEAVNSLIDKDKNPVRGAAAARNEDGIKQKLEKKEGLFRKNMMGKRVNYAARSVISPDPNIETNEIGVPPVFATRLTYPEPVTSHNFRDMQQAVINGCDKWPGAFAIENENGQVVNLRNKSVDDRIALANQLLAPTASHASKARNKKVHRHLTNGDVVLMNRQPTLHKPSIMGHRVRVLTGEKTIRMHYANCNTYNADFDGDEMNMHFPQNEVARAEALRIADTDHQYLSGTQGKPLRGLIQDHISMSVAMCSRDAFFNRGDYHQLIYSALRPESGHILTERIQLVAPAIIKPVPRWTGKQVITTLLVNMKPPNCGDISMDGRTQLKATQWGTNSEEGTVLIKDSEFITGILDKSQIGASSGGLIHAVHEVYGPAVAGKMLSAFGRLLTKYLNMRGFSCGIEDLRLTPEGEKARLQALRAADDIGLQVASRYVSLEGCSEPADPILLERLSEVMRDDSKQEGLDLLMNSSTGEITEAVQSECVPGGLVKDFPKNQMQAMTTSGAKGSRVNASLISCNLGQQVLEGRRVPLMVTGKSLPCFDPFDSNARAGGYIVNRFLTGIRPQEYYFHHMAGREGLIDTAVKTSRSGYLQRCLIKGLEGLTVNYDTTVRDSDGTMIQFLYGEDGLDVTKQKYLSDFRFILQNVESEAAQLKFTKSIGDHFGANKDLMIKYMKSAIKHAKTGSPTAKVPLSSLYDPALHAFVTSETFFEAMASYVKENKDGLVREKGDTSRSKPSLNKKNAELLFAMKYLRSLVEPGEPVGLVAAQSVGEPSTQMTLNTFHLAGHSAKNVTLGIPRLREILMTASTKISTPAMTLYPIEELSDADCERFTKSIGIMPLSDILDKVSVDEVSGRGTLYDEARIYKIKLKFFPSKDYTKMHAITVEDVLSAVTKNFLANLISQIKKATTKTNLRAKNAAAQVGQEAGAVETARTPAAGGAAVDDDEGSDEGGDEDATNAKQRANRGEEVSYGPDDEDDEAVRQANARAAERDEMEDEGIGGSPPPEQDRRDGDEDEDDTDYEQDISSAMAKRREYALDTYAAVTDFACDEQGGSWCSATLEYKASDPKLLILDVAQQAVARTTIHQISGVKACTFIKAEKGKRREIQAEGVNLVAMQKYMEVINPHQTMTNDIGAVLDVYGVEACRRTIVNELHGVFQGHSISVDMRHLNLIADYMTRNGGFAAFSRMGLKGNASPFTKMSFETTLAFLKDAVLDGDWDELRTPSSRLVMGRLGRVGTGGFDVLTQLPTHHVDSLA